MYRLIVHLCTPKRLFLLAMLALVVSPTLVEGQTGPAAVVASQVVQRQVTPKQQFVATVMPARQSTVGSAVDGRVLDFYVNDGQHVTKDQPLAQLRTETLEIELAAAQAEFELRRQMLAELENGTRKEEIAQAKAQMIAAESAEEYARIRLARAEKLRAGNAGSVEEYDEARSGYQAAAQSHIAAQQAYAMAVEGPRVEKIAQAKASLDVQAAQIRSIEDRIGKHTIRSPFDGFVSAEHTEKGAWVTQGGLVASVIELDPVEVEVFVPEEFIRFIHIGGACEIMLDALPGETYEGTVARIVPQANVRSRTFPVKVTVPNREVDGDLQLKAGMLAHVSLPSSEPATVVLVPKDALVLGGAAPIVYVVSEDKTVRPVPVKTSFADGSYMAIQGQLQPGDLVVVTGNERLRPGAEILVTREVDGDGNTLEK
ncbi:MAG: efflux RND transporter periplasmic adaptor subunit [Pirellulaceae bacterium]